MSSKNRRFISEFWALTRPYWYSGEKWAARGLLGAVIALNLGLVYLEAAAHGLPVVAHDVGGVSEAVLDGRTGLLVPPHRPAQLAAAFEKLIHDEALRRSLGAAGREWARRTRWEESASALFGSAQTAA